MQPAKNASVGDVFRVSSTPYDDKTSPEMGHFIREARKLTRNNTFIGMEDTKDTTSEQIHLNLKESWNRWSSAENLSVERRGSMIPVKCQAAGRPKAPIEREKIVRKKPPVPPKALAKHQDPIKIYRAERWQEKKMDMEHQLEQIREQIAGAELTRQRVDQHNREVIDLLKREVDNLKSTCEKLTDAVQRSQNSDDLFLKMKQEGEFSFYSRSFEVSKKILSNTFRRRKSNSARATCFQPSAGTSHDAGANFHNGDQCDLSDSASNTLSAIELPGVSSSGDGDHSLERANSAPETPMNIVTSLYYLSKIRSVEMDDGSQERNVNENPLLQTSEQELVTKKKTRMSKIGGWFKTGKR